MFGMAPAIGLLVDDAIVVGENVERVMMEDNLSSRETEKIHVADSGALVGIAMVLFGGIYPDGLFGGSTGAIYRHSSLLLLFQQWRAIRSGCVDSDASAVRYAAKPVSAEHHEKSGFFGWFNTVLDHKAATFTILTA